MERKRNSTLLSSPSLQLAGDPVFRTGHSSFVTHRKFVCSGNPELLEPKYISRSEEIKQGVFADIAAPITITFQDSTWGFTDKFEVIWFAYCLPHPLTVRCSCCYDLFAPELLWYQDLGAVLIKHHFFG